MARITGSGWFQASSKLERPVSLVATVMSTTRIVLTWVDSSDRNTSYRVYRSTNGVTYSLIATLGDVATYDDTTLSSGTTYYYRVEAVRGSSISDSAYASGTTNSPEGSWQLSAGHWVPAKMPMYPVFPRSDAPSTAAFRWAHPSMLYTWPICVQGGAWPFYYEFTAAPAGATIGNFLTWNAGTGSYDVPADYGVVSWTPTSGTHNFAVRVTDQDGGILNFAWSVTVDASKFIFLSATAPGTGVGTIGDPLTWVQAFGTSTLAITYPTKVAVFRGGTFTCTGHSDANTPGNLQLDGGDMPTAWMAFPGELPILDFNNATQVIYNSSADGEMSDSCYVGLRFRNARQDVNNAHYIWATTRFDRQLVWRNYFEPLQRGLVGNDNPACIFYSSPGNYRTHIAIVQNTFDGMGVGGGNGVASIDSYDMSYSLWEHNVLKNMQSSYGHWQKGRHQYCTVRHETGVENNTATSLFVFSCGGDGGGGTATPTHDVEFCFNTGVGTGTVFSYGYTSTTSNRYNIWSYRNSLRGNLLYGLAESITQQVAQYDITTDTDVSAGQTVDTWPGTYGATNLLLASTALDANGKLVGASRTSYLGTHGAEIA